MERLKDNDKIKLEDGREATVLRFLGEGAQGAVYMVTVDGVTKAMKWFRRQPDNRFIKNIRKNISDGAPSPLFLWPEAITKVRQGSLGYVMPMKPQGYYEFSKFLLAKVRFTSFRAIINAAMSLCDAFRLLHANGLSYQDLNDGGFFINPQTGEVRICDCDNVYPHGENSGILGKARYMAPEIVMGKQLPNRYTDRFSLTVIRVMMFCIDHPFEGFNVVKHPCLTEAIEQRLFGKDICFIFDKTKTINRPVRGVHRNVLTIWPLLPQHLKDVFTEQFSSQLLHNPPERMTEMQWMEVFVSLRDHLMRCPECGDETFVYPGEECINPRCNYKSGTFLNLSAGSRCIPLVKGNVLRFERKGTPAGIVFENPGQSDQLIIKNVDSAPWTVLTPSGKSLIVPPNGFMPVKKDLIINASTKFKITE